MPKAWAVTVMSYNMVVCLYKNWALTWFVTNWNHASTKICLILKLMFGTIIILVPNPLKHILSLYCGYRAWYRLLKDMVWRAASMTTYSTTSITNIFRISNYYVLPDLHNKTLHLKIHLRLFPSYKLKHYEYKVLTYTAPCQNRQLSMTEVNSKFTNNNTVDPSESGGW
jgi:hypothetical protein